LYIIVYYCIFFHFLSFDVERPESLGYWRVTQEESIIILFIKLSQVVSVIVNVDRTPKHMEVADIRRSFSEHIIGSFLMPFHYDGYVLSVASSVDSLSSELAFNIKRQEMEETIHVTFSEDDEAISQTNTEGDAINFNENRSFLEDEFIEPRPKNTQCSVNIEYFPYEPPEFAIADGPSGVHEHDYAESAEVLESAKLQDNVLSEPISNDQPTQSSHLQLKLSFKPCSTR
nr:hypothetical protein [Tanacetum cinerariifolium]